jgi:hypothetical protein
MNDSDVDYEKLARLFSYWISHNAQHKKEIKKWIKRIKKSTSKEIVQDLKEGIRFFNEINEKFSLAKDRLEKENIATIDKKAKNKKDTPNEKVISHNRFELKEVVF